MKYERCEFHVPFVAHLCKLDVNVSTNRRLRELEGRGTVLSSIRETKGRSLDSLSDLTNIDFDMDFAQYDKER